MKLSLHLGKDIDYTDFVKNYIVRNLYDYIRLNLSETKSRMIENHLKNDYKINITMRQLVDFAFRNLNIDNSKGTYKVYIDPSIVVPGTSLKLDSLIRLIEYGDLEVKGLGLFTKGRNFIQDNLTKLYGQYERIGI